MDIVTDTCASVWSQRRRLTNLDYLSTHINFKIWELSNKIKSEIPSRNIWMAPEDFLSDIGGSLTTGHHTEGDASRTHLQYLVSTLRSPFSVLATFLLEGRAEAEIVGITGLPVAKLRNYFNQTFALLKVKWERSTGEHIKDAYSRHRGSWQGLRKTFETPGLKG